MGRFNQIAAHLVFNGETKMHLLIIKGPPFYAVLKAKQIGIDIMLTQSSSAAETWAYTTANWHLISSWFLEDFAHKAPFETGSLLWYRSVET